MSQKSLLVVFPTPPKRLLKAARNPDNYVTVIRHPNAFFLIQSNDEEWEYPATSPNTPMLTDAEGNQFPVLTVLARTDVVPKYDVEDDSPQMHKYRVKLSFFLSTGPKTRASIEAFFEEDRLSPAVLEALLQSVCTVPDARRPKLLDLLPRSFAFVDVERLDLHAERRAVADRAATACRVLPPRERAAILKPFIPYVDRDLIANGFVFGGEESESQTLFGEAEEPASPSSPHLKAGAVPAHAEGNNRVSHRGHLNVNWAAGDIMYPMLEFSSHLLTELRQREVRRRSFKSVTLAAVFPTRDSLLKEQDTLNGLTREYRNIKERLLAFDQVAADCQGLLASEATKSLIVDGDVGLQRVREEVDAWMRPRWQLKTELMPVMVRLKLELQASRRDLSSVTAMMEVKKFAQKATS